MTLVSVPANPVPENAISGTITTPDGVTLRYARWSPPAGRKGTVCIFPGRTEFIEKYFEVVRDLRSRGFAVAVLDWRGQGLSQRFTADQRKGHVRNFDDYETDLETFVREVVLPDCPPPIFALAHSMGGLILLRSSRRGQHWFDRLVVSAPMLELYGIRFPGLTRALAKTLRLFGMGERYVPGGDASMLQSAPFNNNPLTSDPVRYARNAAVIEAEPKLMLGMPTVAWIDSAFSAMADVSTQRFISDLRQPVLIVAAGQDTIVSTSGIEAFAMRLRTGSHLVVPGSRHEILMEQDRIRSQFWAAFDAFVPGTPLYK
jgi:lysophospholipase